jgi:hypothetical protein
MLEARMLATLLAAAFCSLLALGLAVEVGSRWLRGAMATIVAATLLAMIVAYLDLASKQLSTVSMARTDEAPVVQMVSVRQGIAPSCNCVKKSE